MKKQTQFKL